MPPIKSWSKLSDSPRLRYRNRESGAIATAFRTESSRAKKWRAVLSYQGYKLWSRDFETKAAAADSLREQLREKSAPRLTCDCCGEEVMPVHNEDGNLAVKYHYDCRECGFEGPTRWISKSAE